MASDVYELIRSSYSGPFGNLPLSKFLMLRGERMKGGAFPRNIRKGAPRKCFRNSWSLALADGLEYWEGHAWDPALGCIPIHHAWCRDSSSGKVVEPTWHHNANALYFGIHIPAKLLTRNRAETGTFGVLDNFSVFSGVVAARYFGWDSQK